MTKRIGRIFYIPEKQNQKATLLFDAGHENGEIYVYEFKRSLSFEEIEQQIKEQKPFTTDALRTWIDRTYGTPMIWQLAPEGQSFRILENFQTYLLIHSHPDKYQPNQGRLIYKDHFAIKS